MALYYHWKIFKESKPLGEGDHIQVMQVLLKHGARVAPEDIVLLQSEGGLPSSLLENLRLNGVELSWALRAKEETERD